MSLGDVVLVGAVSVVLIFGVGVCYHVLWERPRYNARKQAR